MEWVFLISGIGAAIIGGDLFVRGAAGISARLRISTAFLGATLGALATSFPELSVGIISAIEGRPEISLGDVLGSNVVNISLILAIGLCFMPLQAPRSTRRIDFPTALLVPVVLFLMTRNGGVSRIDGILLLGFFGLWMALSIGHTFLSRIPPIQESRKKTNGLAATAAGLALLGGAGHFIVTGSARISEDFGISEFSVGATLVAFGTSTPELATLLIAKSRRQSALGLGTILGSNIVNGLLIAGLAATIHPIRVDGLSVAITLGSGILSTLLILPNRDGWIGKSRAPLLLACYAATTFLLTAIGR